MNAEFSRTLSLLRQEKGVSQRTAAGVLGISQALLSHYENGIREPGLAFVVKACDYYGVSADYLLGRTLTRDGTTIGTEELYDISDEKDNSMRGSVLALLSKKLLVNSANHNIFMDRLVFSSNEITVKIHIHIIHGLYMGKGLIHKEIVHIKRMLRQFQSAISQQSCTVNHRMH